jgi:hypothetical protein
MPNSLRSSLAKLWPGIEIDPKYVGLSHVYFAGWDKLPADEKSRMFAKLHRWPEHIGLCPLVKSYVQPVAVGRKARTSTPVYTPADAALAYIDQQVDAAKPAMRQRLRAALLLMYTCGLTHVVTAALTGEAFVTTSEGMLLVTPGYIYVLTPIVRDAVRDWLAVCPTPAKPFARTLRVLTQHKFLTESYAVAQSN